MGASLGREGKRIQRSVRKRSGRMSKTLVAYYTQTGNTLRIAESIYEALPGEKEINALTEIKSLDGYDLVYIGFPIHNHNIPKKVQDFLKKVPKNKKIALFSTYGSLTGSRLSREALEHATVLASGAQLLGTFGCRGRVPYSVLETLESKPEHKAWAEMAASARTHPDATDMEEAKVFAKWIKDKGSAKK
jgi:flavodoxin